MALLAASSSLHGEIVPASGLHSVKFRIIAYLVFCPATEITVDKLQLLAALCAATTAVLFA